MHGKKRSAERTTFGREVIVKLTPQTSPGSETGQLPDGMSTSAHPQPLGRRARGAGPKEVVLSQIPQGAEQEPLGEEWSCQGGVSLLWETSGRGEAGFDDI